MALFWELLDNTTMERDSFCVRTIANYSTARSPAFDIKGTWEHPLMSHETTNSFIIIINSMTFPEHFKHCPFIIGLRKVL